MHNFLVDLNPLILYSLLLQQTTKKVNFNNFSLDDKNMSEFLNTYPLLKTKNILLSSFISHNSDCLEYNIIKIAAMGWLKQYTKENAVSLWLEFFSWISDIFSLFVHKAFLQRTRGKMVSNSVSFLV